MPVAASRFAAAVLTAVLAPLLVPQGLHVRRATPRLPGAAGPVRGEVPGVGEPLRLVVLGESTVDGVGARDHEEALTGRLAHTIAARTGRGVRWHAVGRSGADAATVRAELLDRACADPADVVVIALGVNDTIGLHSAARYRRDLLGLVVELRARLGPVPVLLAGVPTLGGFPTLPQPLRAVLGLRARVLDSAAAELAALPGVRHAPMPPITLGDGSFAADGFHPGPGGYRVWGEQLAGQC